MTLPAGGPPRLSRCPDSGPTSTPFLLGCPPTPPRPSLLFPECRPFGPLGHFPFFQPQAACGPHCPLRCCPLAPHSAHVTLSARQGTQALRMSLVTGRLLVTLPWRERSFWASVLQAGRPTSGQLVCSLGLSLTTGGTGRPGVVPPPPPQACCLLLCPLPGSLP